MTRGHELYHNKVWPPAPKSPVPRSPMPRKVRYADFVSIMFGCISCPFLFLTVATPFLLYTPIVCGIIGSIIGFRQRDSFWGRLGLVLSAIVPAVLAFTWLMIGFWVLREHIL